MSFDDIEPFRKAIRGTPIGIITPSMSSLMWVILSYPDGCFIGQDALAKEACLRHDNFKKVLRRCTDLGLILREQRYARKGVRQCYRVNMKRLNELSRVENTPPIITNRVEHSHELGGISSANGSTQLHPYKEYKYKKSSRDDLFNSVLSFIPALKRFDIGKDIPQLVEELEHRGTSLEAIRDRFRTTNWNAIDNPKSFVTSVLKDLVALPVRYSADHRPPKCANPECDEETRTLPYAVPIPEELGGGKTTTCLECNHYWVNKKNGY